MSVSIHPSTTLGFPRPLTRNVDRSLTISNNNVQPVAFRVKTTTPKRYCVTPNSGRVGPGQNLKLKVTLQAMEKEPPLLAKCNDKFMIQTIAIMPGKESSPISDIWNATDAEPSSKKIRVTYLPPERSPIQEEEELAPVPPSQPSAIDPVKQQSYTIDTTTGRGAPPIPGPDETRDPAPIEETREAEPAPVVNAVVDHPPPRQSTPQPIVLHLYEKLAEATAEVDRLKASLAVIRGPEANELHGEPSARNETPSVVVGTEPEVSRNFDGNHQPEDDPLAQTRLEMLAVSEPPPDSSPSSNEAPTQDSPSVSTNLQSQSKFAFPETEKYPETSKPPMLSEDQGTSTNARTFSSNESAEQDEGGNTQPSEYSKTAGQISRGDENGSRSSENEGDQLSRSSSSALPILPPAPTDCFSREENLDEILAFIDRAVSVVLFGSVGIGKSFVALTLLHHDRTVTKFGGNRFFLLCEDLSNSSEGFLEHLSSVLHIEPTTTMAQLRSYLESSPPLLLVLDGVDPLFDPLTSESQRISAMVEEIGKYEHVCLITTSRANPEIRGFQPIEVPALSESGAQNTFYNLSGLAGSPALDTIIAKLDFHPLSTALLASCVQENDMDEPTLLKAWEEGQTGVLKTSYHQKLRSAIEPVFSSPRIAQLGATGHIILGAVAATPGGVDERELERRIGGAGEAVETLCKSSLVYRQDGIVKMISPVRSCLLESTSVPTRGEEDPFLDADYIPGAWLPRYDQGAPDCVTPSSTIHPGTPAGVTWIGGLSKRRFLGFFTRWGAPSIFVSLRGLAKTPPAPEQ